jgi:hypothetical protein
MALGFSSDGSVQCRTAKGPVLVPSTPIKSAAEGVERHGKTTVTSVGSAVMDLSPLSDFAGT